MPKRKSRGLSASLNTKLVLLDTNVWRYLVDAGRVAELKRRVSRRSSAIRIAVSPSTVHEIAMLGDEGLKTRLLNAVTNPAWKRLMSDTHNYAEELFSAISKHRHNWIFEQAPCHSYSALLRIHTRKNGGWWDRVKIKTHPDRQALESDRVISSFGNARFVQASKTKSRQDVVLDRIEAGKEMRERLKGQNLNTSYLRIKTEVYLGDQNSLTPRLFAGDHWRVNSLLWASDGRLEDGRSEWLFERVQLDKLSVNNDSYVRFWMEEVSSNEVPSHWVWCFMEAMTATRKQSSGTYWDMSLATHCSKVDYIVSADKIFHDMLVEVSKVAEFRVAGSMRIKGGSEGVEDLFDFISAL